MNPVIEIKNYTKIIKGQTILDHIDLALAPGQIHGFVGYNGSGKTMLFKAICGFIHPSEGEVIVNDQRIGTDTDFPGNTGIIIEQPQFIGEFNAFANLKLLAEIQNKIGDQEIREALTRLGLEPESKKKVRAFSLGMKQRLALAQAIMEQPAILILDEPMNSLDKDGVAMTRTLLLEAKEKGTTILICSHVSEDIQVLCDNVWTMDRGRAEKTK